jgi:cysteine synthase A
MPQLPLLNPTHINGYLQVSDRLAGEEGFFAGFSSGANVAAAVGLLNFSFQGKTAVVLICDSGLKYLSTDLWE